MVIRGFIRGYPESHAGKKAVGGLPRLASRGSRGCFKNPWPLSVEAVTAVHHSICDQSSSNFRVCAVLSKSVLPTLPVAQRTKSVGGRRKTLQPHTLARKD